MRISGQHGAPRLLHGRQRNPAPAVEASAAQECGDRQFRSARDQRLNGRHAEHHRVADDFVHLVALQDGLGERHRDRQFAARARSATATAPDIPPDRADDPRQILPPAAVEHGDFVARRDAQDPGEVLRLVARQGNRFVSGVERGREKAMHRGEL